MMWSLQTFNTLLASERSCFAYTSWLELTCCAGTGLLSGCKKMHHLCFLGSDFSILCSDFTFLSFLNGGSELFFLLLLVQGCPLAAFQICKSTCMQLKIEFALSYISGTSCSLPDVPHLSHAAHQLLITHILGLMMPSRQPISAESNILHACLKGLQKGHLGCGPLVCWWHHTARGT